MGTRIAKAIYKREHDYDVRATANGHTETWYAPLDTPLKTMKNWQENQRATIRRTRPVLAKGTFAADVQTYLAKPDVKGMPFFPSRSYQLQWWSDRFGQRRRSGITVKDVTDGLDVLKAEGKKPRYVDHFRVSLISLWVSLDGKQAYCPAREVDPAPANRSVVRAIPDETLQTILDTLPNPDTYHSAHIRVLVETGLPPALLSKMQPEDVDLAKQTMRVCPRRKGAGVDGRVLPISRGAVDAFKVWLQVGVGPFKTGVLSAWFHRHCLKHGIKGVRLYDLRHTFLTRILAATGSIEIVQGFGMHANASTSQHYTRGAVPGLLAAAMKTLDAHVVH